MVPKPTDAPPGAPPIPRALLALVTLACLSAIALMLTLSDAAKTVGLVYGGF